MVMDHVKHAEVNKFVQYDLPYKGEVAKYIGFFSFLS